MVLKKYHTLFVCTLLFFSTNTIAKSCVSLFDNQHYTIALNQCKEEARHNSAHAQYILGRLYEGGLNVKQNLATAISYYRQAVLNNSVDAQIALGKYHTRQKNYLQSHIFFSLAIENGSMRALSYKQKAEQNLSTQEIIISQDYFDVVKSAIKQHQTQWVMNDF